MPKKRVKKVCTFEVAPYERNDKKCKVQIFNGNDHKIIVIIKRVSAIIALFTFSLVGSASAATPEDLAVRAILGEARGEGYEGMYAVAHAIRNRGHLKGVYGLKAVQPTLTGLVAGKDEISAELFHEASRAWAESENGIDPTHGADHWENTRAFGVPYWAAERQPTAVIGNHAFYKVSK